MQNNLVRGPLKKVRTTNNDFSYRAAIQEDTNFACSRSVAPPFFSRFFADAQNDNATLGRTEKTLCTRFFADAQNDNATLRMTMKGVQNDREAEFRQGPDYIPKVNRLILSNTELTSPMTSTPARHSTRLIRVPVSLLNAAIGVSLGMMNIALTISR